MATLIWMRTAFSVVPQNFLILRCCFIHLWKSSICHLFLYRLATSRAVRWKALVRKAKSRSCSLSWYLTSLSFSGYFSKEGSSVRTISESVSTFFGSRRRHLMHLYWRFFLALTMKKESLLWILKSSLKVL